MLANLHQKLPVIAARGEQVLNVVLVSVTGAHEWGNPVGYCCAPLTFFLVLHLVVVLYQSE